MLNIFWNDSSVILFGWKNLVLFGFEIIRFVYYVYKYMYMFLL